MEPEQDSKDDSAKITHSTNSAAQNAIGMRVDVRDKSEIRTIASFEEKSHAGDQAEHCCFVLWVEQADGDEESA